MQNCISSRDGPEKYRNRNERTQEQYRIINLEKYTADVG